MDLVLARGKGYFWKLMLANQLGGNQWIFFELFQMSSQQQKLIDHQENGGFWGADSLMHERSLTA
jgi:hypothetical protein